MTDTQLEFHLPAPPVSGDTALIPARMVNEFAYCPRLAYLMWTQGEWAETGDTVEGRRVHARVDKPNAPLPAPQAREGYEAPEAGKTVSRSLTLSSTTLGVIAKLDIAEAEDGVVTPVDYKRGKRPHVAQGAYEPERIQICLQALLLEEHGYRVEEGARAYRAGRFPAHGGANGGQRVTPDRLAKPHSAAAQGQPEMSALRARDGLPAGRGTRTFWLLSRAAYDRRSARRGASARRAIAACADRQGGRDAQDHRRGEWRGAGALHRHFGCGAVRQCVDHHAGAGGAA